MWDPEDRMDPLEALQHPWITEGLPPQVLIHHKRMLGIDVPSNYESSDDEMSEIHDMQNLKQHSLIAESIERPTH